MAKKKLFIKMVNSRSNRTIQFIYFDIGQVLVSLKQGWLKFCTNNKLDQTQANLFSEVWAKYSDQLCSNQLTSEEFNQYLISEAKFQIPSGFNIVNETVNCFSPILPMQEFLRELSSQYPIGLLSNAYPQMIHLLSTQGKLPKINYSHIIDSSEISLIKPDNKIYLYAQKKSKSVANQILFIDDKLENIQAAASLGWQTFQFDENKTNKHLKSLRQHIKEKGE